MVARLAMGTDGDRVAADYSLSTAGSKGPVRGRAARTECRKLLNAERQIRYGATGQLAILAGICRLDIAGPRRCQTGTNW